MRAQTEAWKAKLRKIKEQEEAEREESLFREVVEPVTKDVAAMLEETGDKVSQEGLEALARWKLDV